MKLTNYMRDAFIRAAMNDVPSVDYVGQANTIASAALAAAFAKEFPGVDMEKADASGWLKHVGVKMPVNLPNLFTAAPSYECLEKDAKVWAKLCELDKLHDRQVRERNGLQEKLHAVAYSVSTRKALVAALPEFEKYLPEDEPKAIRSLPVVANVVTDFVKAGWPKGGKK